MKITFFRTLLIAVCMLSAGPALAAPRDDALAGISRCAGLTDDRVFLDCLYGAAQPLRAELGLPPASPAQIRLVPPALAPASPLVAREMALASGALRMTSYDFSPTGRFTVTLSNGEVWGQAPQDNRLARWKKPAGSYIITVTKNWAGSYQLDIKGDHTYFVQQVK
jgi:hypothetical protein